MLKSFRIYAASVTFYKQCKALPLAPELKDQLARASSSVSLSIAEGYGRIYKREKKRFYRIGLGSLRECQAVLELADVKAPRLLDLADYSGAGLYKLCN